jgi:hypothetical protein
MQRAACLHCIVDIGVGGTHWAARILGRDERSIELYLLANRCASAVDVET